MDTALKEPQAVRKKGWLKGRKMPLKIVRNDITKMNTEAIVNVTNENPIVGTVPQGEVFITPGFNLQSEFIIHAVSPLLVEGDEIAEQKLRSCYRKSLALAKENNIKSISFPLIATGSFKYPKEEGLRIAIDEINAFLLENDMLIFLVVFDSAETSLAEKLAFNIDKYIEQNYVDLRKREEYFRYDCASEMHMPQASSSDVRRRKKKRFSKSVSQSEPIERCSAIEDEDISFIFEEQHESKLEERMQHLEYSFSQYLMYLISSKGLTNADVYKRAIVDRKLFSKIKNNPDYHPQKITVLCLCIGVMLNLDEAKDFLARAGYALSPSDKTDIIFSYFIENKIYNMLELDIQLEEHGLPCLIK